MIKHPTNAKIGNLERALRINKNILRLQVPMQDLPLMQVINPKQHLHHQINNQVLLQQLMTFLPGFDINRQIPELTIVHDHGEGLLGEEVLFEGKDVGVEEVAVDLHLGEGFLVLLGGHACELDCLAGVGEVG